jgi:hypothetical protein
MAGAGGAATAQTVDLASTYYKLGLTGLETVFFRDLRGISQGVEVQQKLVNDATEKPQITTVVGKASMIQISLGYTVLAADTALWTWLTAMLAGKRTEAMKTGTITLCKQSDNSALKTWNLDQVFLTSFMLDSMGGDSWGGHLTASLTLHCATAVQTATGAA